jgi:hypothetical protein
MVVNFRARGISRDARKLARTPTLKKKKRVDLMFTQGFKKKKKPFKQAFVQEKSRSTLVFYF